jgi:hypothetical protein
MCGRNADDKPVYGNNNPVIHTQNNQIFADEFDPNQLLYYQRKNTQKNNAIDSDSIILWTSWRTKCVQKQ